MAEILAFLKPTPIQNAWLLPEGSNEREEALRVILKLVRGHQQGYECEVAHADRGGDLQNTLYDAGSLEEAMRWCDRQRHVAGFYKAWINGERYPYGRFDD